MAVSTLALRCYQEIVRNERLYGSDAKWIAGIMLSGKRPGKRLNCLLTRCQKGDLIMALSFRMPYDGVSINGIVVKYAIFDADSSADINNFRLEG